MTGTQSATDWRQEGTLAQRAITQVHPNGCPGNKWECVRDTLRYILEPQWKVPWGGGGGGVHGRSPRLPDYNLNYCFISIIMSLIVMLLCVYMYYLNLYFICKCLASNDVLWNVLIWANESVLSYLSYLTVKQLQIVNRRRQLPDTDRRVQQDRSLWLHHCLWGASPTGSVSGCRSFCNDHDIDENSNFLNDDDDDNSNSSNSSGSGCGCNHYHFYGSSNRDGHHHLHHHHQNSDDAEDVDDRGGNNSININNGSNNIS